MKRACLFVLFVLFCFLIFLTRVSVWAISLQPFSGTFANFVRAFGVGCRWWQQDWGLMIMRDCSDGFDSCQIEAIRCLFFTIIPQAAVAAAVCIPLIFRSVAQTFSPTLVSTKKQPLLPLISFLSPCSQGQGVDPTHCR